MDDQIIIRDFTESITLDYKEVSTEIDGDRVFFRVPSHLELNHRAEPFLGIALLEAMIRNIDIRIENSLPLSERLYKVLPELQSIYSCWNSDLHKIEVHARIEPSKDFYSHVACFWSAGVDSSHTLYRNIQEISHLLILIGFEVGGNTPEAKLKTVKKQSAFARSIGKELITIETNAKQWYEQRKIMWSFAQGLILSSIGSMFNCKRVFIGASHTYNELFPWGSHPLTDPMWSTESTEVIHYGAGFRRGDKMRDLCKNQEILDNLQVCWNSPHENCGKCGKCIRTMTALYLLGASSKSLPKLDDIKKLKIFRWSDESGATFLEDMMILAKNTKNKKVQRILNRLHKGYQIKRIMAIIDQYMMRNILRRVYYKIKNSPGAKYRVSLRESYINKTIDQ